MHTPSGDAASIRAVFFDAGNTLFYEAPTRFEIYTSAARELGLSVTLETVRAAMHREHEHLPRIEGESARYTDRWFRAYVPAVFRSLGASEQQLDGLLESLLDRYRKTVKLVLFPETLATLEELRRRKFTIGIISNWSPRLMVHLERLGIVSILDFILISAVEGIEKPNPQLFHRACERAGVEPHEAIHVGDHPANDAAGARAAGVHGILINRENDKNELLASVKTQDATIPVIRSLSEIFTFLGDPA
ncbi:MAG: HAD family hydrolase [Planctomycetota bacterium]